ncbi:Myb-like DNA-binding domain-containing protein [Spironucleus salmonicida]|uniref:Myb-like DNA-binding domain-containing protein n=1 Tax=Spironucleus salmonicida TaxID=348837 RepID=V6LIJ0_9EUKA|nr:Myb-like DNA-binding domain-containing protein [Spironucleus salmonicida]|eukprot:EST43531.1 Myb-like DNA-binding domain-containing protein [Spironucleus salmonicida]
MNFDSPSCLFSLNDLSMDFEYDFNSPILEFNNAEFQQNPYLEHYQIAENEVQVVKTADDSSSYEESNKPRRTQRRVQLEWSEDEDKMLEQLVMSNNRQNWPQIARSIHKMLPGTPIRSPSQCNQRWSRVVNPVIKKGKWSENEDKMLVSAIANSPPRKWKVIADKIPGRTDIQVRYRLKAIGECLVRKKLINKEQLPE